MKDEQQLELKLLLGDGDHALLFLLALERCTDSWPYVTPAEIVALLSIWRTAGGKRIEAAVAGPCDYMVIAWLPGRASHAIFTTADGWVRVSV